MSTTREAPEDAEFDSLVQATLHINSSQDLETMCRHILESACVVLGTEAASLMLIDPKSGKLQWLSALGEARSALVEADLRPGEGIAGWVAQAGQTVVANDVSQDERFCSRIDALSGFQTRSLLCVPMVAQGRILGVLEFINRPAERPFTSYDERKAQAFASLAAVALENGRLIREAEEMGNVREISRFKTEMVGVVAHELRNPLTTIRGFGELICTDENLQIDAARRFGGLIHDNALRMERLIDDFLNLSRLESGQLAVREEPTSVKDAVQASAARFASETHPIEQMVADDVTVLADRDRLEQVLDNLLSNAVKYSPDGGPIRVEVSVDADTVKIAVKDRGLGIPPESLPRLFQHFYRVPDPRHSKQRGTGLGLTIVKTLVEKMNGRIGVECPPAGGSTFWVELPTS